MAALKFEGISVATVGPALGHEMFVDDTTLLQAEQAGVAGRRSAVALYSASLAGHFRWSQNLL